MKFRIAHGVCAWLLGTAAALQAAPFTPSHDDEVVQRLPARVGAALRAHRAELARDPSRLPLALALAREAIERARLRGDLRELGLAQSVLAPWWGLSEPPAAVRLLRATVRQSQHDFEAALADLELLTSADPAVPPVLKAQASLTRASVLQVRGRLDEARRLCDELASLRHADLGRSLHIAARACSADLRSLRGEAPWASIELAALARSAPEDAWLTLVRAELAERLGDRTASLALYRRAVAMRPDVYAIAALADHLIDEGRAAEALAVIAQGDADADALLLRRAIAQKRLNDPRAAADAATLKARFAAAGLRGEDSHIREQARLALDVEGNAPQALALALENWLHQKEPADALLLVRAAAAAGDRDAAEPVRRLQDKGWHDVRLVNVERGARP